MSRIPKGEAQALAYCKRVCKQFKTLQELHTSDNAVYNHVKEKGWYWECFLHLKVAKFGPEIKAMTREQLRDVAERYPDEESLCNAEFLIYKYICKKMIKGFCFSHMIGYDHDKESCKRVSARFNNASEMQEAGFNFLLTYIRLQGWQDYCCAHFTHKLKYTIEECVEMCRAYDTLNDLRGNINLYTYVKKHEYEEVCFAHLVKHYKHEGEELIPVYKEDNENTVVPLGEDKMDGFYKFSIPYTEQLTAYMRIANNLYNQTVYEFRSAFEDKDNQRWYTFYSLRDRMQQVRNLEGDINYYMLPSDMTACCVIRDAHAGFLSAATRWRHGKRARLPGYRPKGGLFQIRVYKHKGKGQRMITKDGYLSLGSMFDKIRIPEYEYHKQDLLHIKGASLVPSNGHIDVVLRFERAKQLDPMLDEANYAAIDIGIDNLLTMVDLYQTTIYRGRFMKSYNQLYNDRMRQLRKACHWKRGMEYTKRMKHLDAKRHGYLRDAMQKISRHLVDYLQSRHIGTLIIGWDGEIQQRTGLGGNVKRMFQLIPYGQLIGMIRYKCEHIGINVVLTEESYTSKCDALALESVEHHEEYLGKRVKRGLYRSSTGKYINADVNGAINIMRKVIGDCSFVKEIIGKGHLFSPVGYSNPFEWKANATEQSTLYA